jgi:hypothetical protein
MDQLLAVSEKHPIRIMFVLLDSVWDPHPHLGKQRNRGRASITRVGCRRRERIC